MNWKANLYTMCGSRVFYSISENPTLKLSKY
jgi:hypothetical protein